MVLAVYVTPKSARDEVVGWRGERDDERELCVRVTAAPEKGKATKAAGKALAAFLHVPKSSVRCVAGATSRHKKFDVPVSAEELGQLL